MNIKACGQSGSAVEQIHGVVRISQFFFSPALFICPPVAHPPQPAHSQCHLGSIIVFQAEEERRLLKEESKSFQSSHRKKGQGNELEPQRQGAHAGSQGTLLSWVPAAWGSTTALHSSHHEMNHRRALIYCLVTLSWTQHTYLHLCASGFAAHPLESSSPVQMLCLPQTAFPTPSPPFLPAVRVQKVFSPQLTATDVHLITHCQYISYV